MKRRSRPAVRPLQMTQVRSLALLLTVAVSLGASAHAASLRNVLTDYTITSWSQRDGLPPGPIYSLAQAADGHLWIGTSAGLFRFDGVRFSQWEALGADNIAQVPIRALCVSRNGSLWVGFGGLGGVSRIGGGPARHYDEADGLPRAVVEVVIEDQAGTIWVGNTVGLFSLVGDRWQKWAPTHGLPNGPVYSAYLDQQGNLLVGSQGAIFRRRPNGESFEVVETGRQTRRPVGDQAVNQQPRSISQDSSGSIWESDQFSGFRRLGTPRASANSNDDSGGWGRGFRLLIDRRENLWVGTIGQGLWRVRHPVSAASPQVERATSLTGLLSDGVLSLIEDKDGSVWAGTTEGLNRLTPLRVTQFTNFDLVVGLEVTSRGDVWVGDVDELVRFSPGSESASARVPLHRSRLLAMHADADGTLWVATDRGALRLNSGSVSPVPLVGSASLRHIDCITSDGRGGILLHDQERGLFHWTGGRLTTFTLPEALRGTPVALLFTGRRGAIWFGFADGRLMVLGRDGSRQTFGPKDGLTGGTPRQIYEDDRNEVWFASSMGLSKLVNGSFVTIGRDNGLPLDNLTAVIADDARALWVGLSTGILRIRENDYLKAINGRANGIQYALYDRSDGLAGLPLVYNKNRRVIRASDGRLWFVTSRGLTLINPRTLRDIPPVGPIRIEGVTVDGKKLSPLHQEELPARTSRLEIDYSVLSLNAPLRTRFRYWLEGFDTAWIDAGTRRQAFYTNLSPRQYRFRVVASNNDGSWAEPGTNWEFSIRPMFYETGWFYGGGALLFALAIMGIWQLRIRQMRSQFSMLLSERARLSREVQDTLLQSLVGMALQFDVIVGDVPPSSVATRRQLVRMRKQVEEDIREARESILHLRSRKLERVDLSTALCMMAEHATAAKPVGFKFSVTGDPDRGSRKIDEQLLRIGQEAVLNVVRHADANQIWMDLQYEDRFVTLLVADDGRGFDLARVGESLVHFGLVSMRERAEEVGGRLDVISNLNEGTKVKAVVPAWPRR